MAFGLFDAREASDFGERLATLLIERTPAAGSVGKRQADQETRSDAASARAAGDEVQGRAQAQHYKKGQARQSVQVGVARKGLRRRSTWTSSRTG